MPRKRRPPPAAQFALPLRFARRAPARDARGRFAAHDRGGPGQMAFTFGWPKARRDDRGRFARPEVPRWQLRLPLRWPKVSRTPAPILPPFEMLRLASLASPQVARGEAAVGVHRNRLGYWLVLDADVRWSHVRLIVMQRVRLAPPGTGIPVRGMRGQTLVPLPSWLIVREHDAILVVSNCYGQQS